MLKRLLICTVAILPVCAGAEEWNLEALPHYQPQQKVIGVIRVFGASMAGLVKAWEDEFIKYQPGIRFDNHLPSSDAAMAAMITGAADIAPSGREPAIEELLGFNETYNHNVFPVIVGTGAWDAPGGSSWSPVVFVNKDNPLTKLTMKQLDGIFGAERTGGFEELGYTWMSRDARGADENIRTWGQLGLTGEWKDKPIQTYGYAQTGMRHFFELRVFHGGDKWNPNYREYVETGTKQTPDSPGGRPAGSHAMLTELAKDKFGIGWSGIGHARSVPGLKAIALAPADSGLYFEPTKDNFQNHSYPLSRSVFMYLNRPPGTPIDPKLKEFLEYVLSQEGQRMLTHTGVHLPLTPEALKQQRDRLQ